MCLLRRHKGILHDEDVTHSNGCFHRPSPRPFAQAPMPELCDKEAPTCMLPGYVCDLTKGECVPSATTTVAPNAPGPRPSTRSPSPASPSVECRDRSAPGRVSDCPQRKHLCENKLYFDLMTVQCPKTCGRCPGQKKENRSGGSEICVDRHAPGRVSDCPQKKHLCDDALYRDLMAIQCPKTCGRC